MPVASDSNFLSASMRLALNGKTEAHPGSYEWKEVARGFEVADLPVLVEGQVADHIFLARIDPAYFRFGIYNDSSGNRTVDDWMSKLNAVLVVNGSYFSPYGKPDTPFLSEGKLLGPKDYDAKAGAMISSPTLTSVQDLAHQDWKSVFLDATNAMVSYPLLVSSGANNVTHSSRWLANRSFVGEDDSGRILIGTTTDAYFSLARLAQFLVDAQLGLKIGLNLDGGPVACQSISLNGYERKTYGRWEAQVDGEKVHLLTWPYGTWGLPIVLAVLPQ